MVLLVYDRKVILNTCKFQIFSSELFFVVSFTGMLRVVVDIIMFVKYRYISDICK